MAGAYAFARLRGRWGRYERTALAIPLTIAALASPAQVLVGDWAAREVAERPADQARRARGRAEDDARARRSTCSAGTRDGKVKYGLRIPKLLSFLAYHDPNARVQGLDAVPPDRRPPVNVVRVAFQLMVGIGTLLALLGVVYLAVRVRRRRLPESRWFYRALALAGPAVGGRADRRLGDDRGRPPALGRVRGDAHPAGGDRRLGHPGRLRHARGGLPAARGRGRMDPAAARARAARPCRHAQPETAGALMHLYDLPLVFALVGLALYVVLGGADFGAGFWQLTAGRGRAGERIRDHAHDVDGRPSGRPTTSG